MTNTELLAIAAKNDLGLYVRTGEFAVIGDEKSLLKVSTLNEKLEALTELAIVAADVISGLADNIQETSTTANGEWPAENDHKNYLELIAIANGITENCK